MRYLLAALGLLGSFWASNVTATILSYDFTVSSDNWGSTGVFVNPPSLAPKPFGVAEQPTFSGTFQVNNAYQTEGSLVGFKMVTGSKTWTESDATVTNFSYDAAGKINALSLFFGNNSSNISIMLMPSGIGMPNGYSFMGISESLSSYGGQITSMNCTGCFNFVTAPSPPPVQAPTNYGLFIGVRDGAAEGGTIDFRGDLAAQRLAGAFDSLPSSVGVPLTADLTSGGSLSFSQIQAAINDLKMKPNDNLVLYLAGHGSGGIGDETIRLGSRFLLSDDTLTDLLLPMGNVNKWVLIDSCHSGGFWGPGDFAETGVIPLINTDDGDLNRVPKTALLASSIEDGLAYYGSDGLPIISRALVQAWTLGADGFYGADGSHDKDITMLELAQYIYQYRDNLNEYGPGDIGQIVFEAEFGDPVLFRQGLLTPSVFIGNDFSGRLAVASVPEPNSIALIGVALVALGFSRRRKQ